MNYSEEYIRAIFRKFQYQACWLPNTKLTLGDIGVYDGIHLKVIGNLSQQGIKINPSQHNQMIDFSVHSHAQIGLGEKAEGESLLEDPLKAEISIDFLKKGSFVFELRRCQIDTIGNKIALGDEIKRRYAQGKWDKAHVIVDEVVRAENTSIIISNSREGKLTLKAGVAPAEGIINLSAGVRVQSQKGELMKILGESGLTPLYRIVRIKPSFLGRLTRKKGAAVFGGVNDSERNKIDTANDIWTSVTPYVD